MNEEDFIFLLKEYLKEDSTVDLSEKFKKEQLDSIDKVNLIVFLEEFTGKEISVIELLECETLNDIVRLSYE